MLARFVAAALIVEVDCCNVTDVDDDDDGGGITADWWVSLDKGLVADSDDDDDSKGWLNDDMSAEL